MLNRLTHIRTRLQEACQNYIRIMVVTSPGRLFVCGTNSFRPMCTTYIITEGNYTQESTKNGQAVCPYDPRHNSTSVFAGKYRNRDIYHLYRVLIQDHFRPTLFRISLKRERESSSSLALHLCEFLRHLWGIL